MTYSDAWIIDANPDDLRQVGLAQNSPNEGEVGISPFFPEARDAYTLLREGISAGRFRGFQVDWGSYAAIMVRSELQAFLTETHGPVGAYEAANAKSATHLADRMRALRAYVDGLPEGGRFKVVVEEF